jgi:hypothetical protein
MKGQKLLQDRKRVKHEVRRHGCDRYDDDMAATLAAAKEVGSAQEAEAVAGDVVLRYDSQEHYERVAASFGMLLEWRDGVPRGAYKGVVRLPLAQILL